MSHDHGHDNHSSEPKPVSFTVPFLMASALLVIIFLFLSLCDPKKHGEHDGAHGHDAEHATSVAGHDEHNADAKTDHVEAKDTMAVETTEHTAADTTHKTEAAHEAHH